ncbi:hypothetical protein HDV62DRAFT_151252 [Trichoderma sp. SZMC 28011]
MMEYKQYYALVEYTIGWVCTLPNEQAAATVMLERKHQISDRLPDNDNTYIFGAIGQHNIVIVAPHSGSNTDATTLVTRMLLTCPNIRISLMVGIGGGIPQKTRLGDVVVGFPTGTDPGVVKWDMGKADAGGSQGSLIRTGSLAPPPSTILVALAKMENDPIMTRDKLLTCLKDLESRSDMPKSFFKSDSRQDILYESTYNHVKGPWDDDYLQGDGCLHCDKGKIVQRRTREGGVMIHYGLIASGNQAIKNGLLRDELYKKYDRNIFCIETEAAGLRNGYPCVVIRGICDYSDSHRNNEWQDYASATAAACAKALLKILPSSEIDKLRPLKDSIPFDAAAAMNLPRPLWGDRTKGVLNATEDYKILNQDQNGGNKADDLASREQFSDSGYASIPRKTFEVSGNFQNEASMPELYSVIRGSDLHLTNIPQESISTSVEEQEDDRTEYSAATGLSNPRLEGLVSQLANQLIGEVYVDGLDAQSIETICFALQDLLKDFALKMGLDAQSQIQRDVMYYTHKYSEKIADRIETRLHERYREDNKLAPEITREMTKDWLKNLTGDFESYEMAAVQEIEEDHFQGDGVRDDHIEQNHEEDKDQNDEEDKEESIPDLGEYRDLISGSPAYSWLLGNLRRESVMEPKCSDSMKDINQKIVSFLPHIRHISKSRSSESFQMTFLINWDPANFLEEQQYEESLDEAIERAVTLTGSAKNAQALTTLQYLRQTWPTTGEHVLKLVKDVMCGPREQTYTCHLREGTQLTAWIADAEFITEVSGTRASIAEIGEQLAWLSASLRSSLGDTGVTFYTPFVHIIQPENTGVQISDSKARCRIEYTGGKEENNLLGNGDCWHNMFRNPVLVKGFPVLRRPKLDTGLEIPLNMIAALANTQRVDEFNGKIFIKGFSTMLIPTDHTDGVVIWHLQYRSNGEHISYFDACVPHIPISISDLEESRNIVGWCSQADIFAGATEANYNVQRSGLPKPTADCVLHNVSISAGKYITGGINFAMGIKDQPIHLIRGSYTPKLEWIHDKYIVLWDEKCKRGWLLNGTTALLHLSRAALKHKQEGPFKSSLLFESESMEEATERLTAESAIKVLTNENNMKLKIYRDKSQYNEIILRRGADREEVIYEEKENFYRFQDLVDDLYNNLEKMVEYQASATNKDGVSLKCRVRKHLDGWEFDDIIKNKDCHPRVATLEAMGQGWINLVTDIGAVVILGNNFGEIIRPSSTETTCDRWSQMPKDRYYLGACVSDLTNIMRSHGEEGGEQLRLTNNISWHNSDKTFGQCQCKGKASPHHSDLVQELRKSKDSRGIPSAGSRTLKPRGAVIFSHNIQLNWMWDDTGSSTKSKPPVSSETSYGVNALVSHQIQMLGGDSNSLSLTSGHLSPGVESATTEQCDSYPGLHESQTGASSDGSLATSISNTQGHFVSGFQTPSRVLGEELLGSHPSSSQEAKVPTSQGNGNTDTQQKNSRIGKRELLKQRFSQVVQKLGCF